MGVHDVPCGCHNCRFVLPEFVRLLKEADANLDTDNRSEWEFSTSIRRALRMVGEA